MLHKLLHQVRNNAVAYTALFIALSGTAFAASSALPRNSVGTAQLKNRAVTGQKVALNTLTGANIKSSTLGTVPNAAHLGRLGPAAFERAITGKCARGQAIQAVSQLGKVTCQSVGTIRGVTAGTGLTGGGRSGNVILAVDPAVVQARVTGTCGPGRAISFISQQGTIICHTTSQTQMMGGTGTANLSTTSAFLAPVGISAPTTTLQSAEVGSADAPSTARHLFVRVATAPGTGNSWTFNFWVNGHQKTSLSCVITGTAQACHTSGSVPIPHGALVALHERATGVTAGTTATFGWIDNTF